MPHQSEVFDPGGTCLITASADWTARIWDAATGHPLGYPLHHPSDVRQAAFTPDGQWIVTACGDGSVRVWDAATSLPLAVPLSTSDVLHTLDISPDGTAVACGSLEGNITARSCRLRSRYPSGYQTGAYLVKPNQSESIARNREGQGMVGKTGLGVVVESWMFTVELDELEQPDAEGSSARGNAFRLPKGSSLDIRFSRKGRELAEEMTEYAADRLMPRLEARTESDPCASKHRSVDAKFLDACVYLAA